MHRYPLVLAGAWIAALLWPIPSAQAQSASGGTYTMRRFVIAGGGGQPQGAPYRAAVTAGQSAAQVSQGGGYRLVSGFHRATGTGPAVDALFCSSFEDVPCNAGATP